MNSKFNTPEECFSAMSEDLTANLQKTKGIRVAYQFEITGDAGGMWYIRLDNGKFDINKGTITDWDCRMKMGQNTFLAIAKKQMNPVMAFLSGRVQMKGNSDKLKYLQKILG
jgi:putative sterol carrier protein